MAVTANGSWRGAPDGIPAPRRAILWKTKAQRRQGARSALRCCDKGDKVDKGQFDADCDDDEAVVLHAPGGAEALTIENRPVPVPQRGHVLIRIEAFGLDRRELFTQQGHSPDVAFPRILGIEAVGTVAAAPGAEFTPRQTVATVMGGMGRAFDGGYAEYTCVPARQVRAFRSLLPWNVLGALPDMLQTARRRHALTACRYVQRARSEAQTASACRS